MSENDALILYTELLILILYIINDSDNAQQPSQGAPSHAPQETPQTEDAAKPKRRPREPKEPTQPKEPIKHTRVIAIAVNPTAYFDDQNHHNGHQ